MGKRLHNFLTWMIIAVLFILAGYGLFMIHWLLAAILFCIYLLYVLSGIKIKK